MIKLFITSLGLFLAIDAVWLVLVAKDFYAKQIGFLIAAKPNLVAAMIFYLIFIFGLCFFVIQPNLNQALSKIIFAATLFGLVTYATYDLTNLATIKNWSMLVTIIDLIWGMTVSTLVSGIVWWWYHI